MNVALITGASGGIGKAIAYRLAKKKKDLLLIARNAAHLEKQCNELTGECGVNAQFIAADLSKPGTAEQIFGEVQNRGLEIEILINNAGMGSAGAFSSLPLQSELDLIQLNISSLVALTHLFLPQMQQRQSGVIINVASTAAFVPVPYMASYAASKAFVRSFTEAISRECAPYPIHIMLFCPGLTKTNFNNAAGINNEIARALNVHYDNTPAQTPEQVADELIKALDKGKHFAVAGVLNRLGLGVLALIPNSFVTRIMANMYRKKLKM